MQASNIAIDDFLGQNSLFAIPVYQRNYAWEEAQCRRLLNDSLALTRNPSKHHFVGSVCVKKSWDMNNESVIIIDGQQRITTLSLMFIAISKVAYSLNTQISNNLCESLLNRYIFLNSFTGERIPKLKLNIQDNKDYLSVIENLNQNSSDIIERHIFENFNFFVKELSKMSDAELMNLSSCMHRMEIAVLLLGDNEDAQEIFDSINSTGLDLTDVDRIRNFMLMNLAPDLQERLYTKYWHKIEDLMNEDIFDDFICSYLVSYGSNHVAAGIKINRKNLYQAFKAWFEDIPVSSFVNQFDTKTEYVLSSLYRGASDYAKLILQAPVTPNKLDSSNDIYFMINAVGKNQLMAVGIYLLRLHNNNRISDKVMNELFKICFSYLIRNRIVPGKTAFGYQTSGNVIHRFDSAVSDYDDIPLDIAQDAMYNAVFLQNRGGYRMATDSEFKAAIKTQSIYLSDKELVKFLLYTIEISDKEARKAVPDFNAKTISIEHIMPQHPSQEWIDEFGADSDEYLHEFGNLTLTNLNSEIGNKPFTEKKEKYMKDSFIGTREICSYATWTYANVMKRNNEIGNKLVTIFKLPSKYESPEYVRRFKEQNVNRTSRTTFAKLGLPIGTELVFVPNPSIKCTIADNINQIEYNGKKYAISSAVKVIYADLGIIRPEREYNGFDWFTYQGMKLTIRRQKIESGEIVLR